MKIRKSNIVPYVTIGIAAIYLVSVFSAAMGMAVTGSSVVAAVVALELSTILSTPAMLLLFMVIPIEAHDSRRIAKKMSVIFMACCMVLTSMVHFVQLSTTLPLIKEGISVPTYLQVGYWPSVPMAVDYLAWGFFAGSAFLCSSLAVGKSMKMLKYTLLSCGILCYAGLLGTVLVNENCWYIAPMGYGSGIVVVCIELIFINRRNLKNIQGDLV